MERRRKQTSNRSSKDPCDCIVFNTQKILPIDVSSVRKLVLFVFKQKKITCQMIAVHFIGKRKSGQLHAQFFKDPAPTDCMTFPIDKDFLGECVICPQIAIEQNPSSPYAEVSHYLIHCLLHLMGYDDTNKEKRRVMQLEEKQLLRLVRKHRCQLHS